MTVLDHESKVVRIAVRNGGYEGVGCWAYLENGVEIVINGNPKLIGYKGLMPAEVKGVTDGVEAITTDPVILATIHRALYAGKLYPDGDLQHFSPEEAVEYCEAESIPSEPERI